MCPMVSSAMAGQQFANQNQVPTDEEFKDRHYKIL